MPAFPSAPLYILKHLIERQAQEFRRYLAFTPDEPIEPCEVADQLGVRVAGEDDLAVLPDALRVLLLARDRARWSGMTFVVPGWGEIVVLNPSHPPTRMRATLMEELAHVYLGHAPTVIGVDVGSGLLCRSHDAEQEREAYWFGGAVLAPKCGLKALYERGGTRADAATLYGVSDDLVGFRTNLHGLDRRRVRADRRGGRT